MRMKSNSKRSKLDIMFSMNRQSQKGSAILYALIISVVGVILVTSLGQYYSGLTKTVFKNNDMTALRAVLNSSMDYTVNGIRNRWCFANNWTNSPTCLLTNDNNVERLLISDKSLEAIQSSMPAVSYGGDISKVRTKSITSSVKWDDITTEHPLYYVVKGLKDIGKDFVFNFKIIRIDNGVQKGREVLLQIEVELQLGSDSFIKTSRDSISAVATVIVFPREISTNALLIAGDLFLDRPDPGVLGAANGNVYIAPVLDPSTPGVQFDSPVFVNGNVYVPVPDTPGYTPVTFADKIIIGSGMVLEGQGSTGTFSKPRSAGGLDDRFYSQTDKFGGFLKGVLLDPGPDEGLKVLAKVDPNAPPFTSGNLCLLRNSAKVDLATTRESQLFLKVKQAEVIEPAASEVVNVTSSYGFVANLGSLDNFYKQSITGDTQFKVWSPSELNPVVDYKASSSGDQRPIMRVTIALNGMVSNPNAYVAADLAADATLDVQMNPYDPTAIMRITTTPYVIGPNVQWNAVNIKVDFINQEKFAMMPYPVKLAGAGITTSSESNIDINIEAFDVAYTTESSGNISSARVKGGPAPNNLSAAECPVGSLEYNTDIKVINGVTHRCYSQFAWHPVMGKGKSNGFSFKRAPGGADKRFVLVRNNAAAGVAGGYFGCSALDASCPVYDAVSAPQEVDWVAFDKTCFTPPKGTDMFPSFGAADWSTTSFTEQSRRSWGFTEPGTATEPGYNPGTLILDGTSSRFDGAVKPTFIVSAIYETCVIKSDANFVSGFFVCDNLVVESRVEPLRVIGTFIAGNMSIHPDAIRAGIRWSNIYHPSAVYELRIAGILSTSDPVENCDVPTDPLWNPFSSVKRAQFLFKCNPISLRSKADPFRWTMVDPDCGLVGSEQKCKYRTMRYDIVELKRQEFL